MSKRQEFLQTLRKNYDEGRLKLSELKKMQITLEEKKVFFHDILKEDIENDNIQ